MFIEVEDRMINADNIVWIAPHDDYPQTKVYILFVGSTEAQSYHVSYNSLKKIVKSISS